MGTSITAFAEGQRLIPGDKSLPRALASFVDLAVDAARADAGSLYVVDRDLNVLVPYVTTGLPPEYVQGCGNVRIGDQCCGRAVQHKKPWIVSDMLTDPLFSAARDAAASSAVRAAFSVPVMAGPECIASLACHFFRPHTPSANDLFRNKIWADLIAFLIKENRQKQTAPRSAEMDVA